MAARRGPTLWRGGGSLAPDQEVREGKATPEARKVDPLAARVHAVARHGAHADRGDAEAERDVRIGGGGLGLDRLAALDGTPFATYSQVLNAIRTFDAAGARVDPASIRVDGDEDAVALGVSVLLSPDLLRWTPVGASVGPGDGGGSVRVRVPADPAE